MAKALILGGKSGLLSQALSAALEERKWDVSIAGREKGDFANPCFVGELLHHENADIIFNTIAWTRVDDAETMENEADLANRIVPLNVALNLAKMQKGHLIHYGTDFIFSGCLSTPFDESSPPNPKNIYGKTKLAGEKEVLRHLPERACILRTAWLFGPGKNNFITTILNASKNKDMIQVVDDQIGSPTYTPDLASWSIAMAEKKAKGVWHAVNSGHASWCELAAEAVALVHGSCRVEPISSSQWPQKAKRPAYSVLNNTKMANYLNITPRSWPFALRDYIFGHILGAGEKSLNTHKKIICTFCFLFLSLFAACYVLARPQSLEQLKEIEDNLAIVPLEGAITSLYRPNYDTIMEANLKLSANEPVFVVQFPDKARIYPQQYMVWHQVVNEVIDDVAFAVTYCPITGTLMAYNASMQGINLIFDVEIHENKDGFAGFLYDGNSVLIDRNSGSLWLQETGMAFSGPLMGRGMPTIPVFWTTWEKAKSVYPDAGVLSRPRGRRPYGRDPYGSYMRTGTYYDNDVLVYPPRHLDRRFHRKAPMYCMEYDNFLLAIEIDYVRKNGCVNFFLGPVPLLAVHDPSLDVVRVFNRQVWADPFLFIMENGNLTDLATRSKWDRATGQAVDGNMKGASMKQYFGVYSMWFAWYSMNPETLVIPGPGEVKKEFLSPAPPGVDKEGKPENNFSKPDNVLPGKPLW